MARIRTYKPEFFTSADVCTQAPLGRLLFLALILEADREGRLAWNPWNIKLRYFPADECDIADLADKLAARGMIQLYQVEGRWYCHVANFERHQVVNNRERPSLLPPPPGPPSTTTTTTTTEGKGRERRVRTRPPRVATRGPRVATPPPERQSGGGVEKFTLPDWIPADPWEAWMVIRKARGGKDTDYAKRLLVKALDAGRAKGHAVVAMLDLIIKSKWIGFEVEWYERQLARDAEDRGEAQPPASRTLRMLKEADRVAHGE
jgi:hypothetical protein